MLSSGSFADVALILRPPSVRNFWTASRAFKWVEKTFDYDKELGVSVQSLIGLKKTVFKSLDFGAITISSYAASHA